MKNGKFKSKVDNEEIVYLIGKSLKGVTEIDESIFNAKTLPEKLELTNKALQNIDAIEKEREKLANLAYSIFTKDIVNYNLDPNNKPLDFIYDKSNEEKIHELKEIIAFVRENRAENIEVRGTKSAFRGALDEMANLSKNIYNAIDNPKESRLHELDEAFNNSLNRARQYLKSDPSKRNITNRLKQLAGATLNITVWFGKQCVNCIRKPIALVANLGKTVFNLGRGDTKSAFKNVKDAARDLRQTMVAGATVFTAIAFAPFTSIPLAAATGLTAIGAGAVAAGLIVAAHLSSLTLTTPGIVVQVGENAVKAAYLKAEYDRTGPSFYTEQERGALKGLHELMNKSDNPVIKQKAVEYMNKLEEYLKGEQLKKDAVGRAIHTVNNIAGEISKSVNKALGTYFNESGRGISAPPPVSKEHTHSKEGSNVL